MKPAVQISGQTPLALVITKTKSTRISGHLLPMSYNEGVTYVSDSAIECQTSVLKLMPNAKISEGLQHLMTTSSEEQVSDCQCNGRDCVL